MIDWQALQSYGWSFFPVHVRSKAPAIKWERLMSQRPTADEVATWQKQGYRNVGIVTGAISGFFALDIDSDDAQAEVDALGIPPTLTIKTRRGRHYYFKHPGFKVANAVAIRGGKMDIRGDGGFVIGPGSHHEKDETFEYTWEDPSPIAEAPQWLLDDIKPKERPPLPQVVTRSAHQSNDNYVQGTLDALRAELANAPEGERNNTLFMKAARVFEFVAAGAITEAAARSELLAIALAIGLPERASLKTIESARKHGMQQPAQIPERTKPRQAATVSTPVGPGISAAALQKKVFDPVRWAVPRLFVEGLTLLAARPKRGKSWLALNCCVAVASGGHALNNIKCDEGDALGLFLEDNERRIADRLTQLLPASRWPDRLTLHTEWARLDDGGLLDIENWIQSVERPRLIVVDVLASVRPRANGKNTPYADDYAALEALRGIAQKHRLAIVAITHTRKAKSDDDVFDEISGTTGMAGAADSALVMQRGEGKADFLYGRGRDMPEFEYAIAFDKVTGLWRLLGNADAHRGNEAELKIVATLVEAGEPMSVRDIAGSIRADYQATKQRLYSMVKSGQIRKAERGRYAAV